MPRSKVTKPVIEVETLTRGRNADYVGELREIAVLNAGILRAQDVVTFAEDPSTALHGRFEWDDTEAGRRYRLFQARNLIRVSVQWLGIDTPKPMRVFVSLKDDRIQPGGGYRTTVGVMSDEDRRVNLLAEALADLQVFRRKYAELQELAQVFAVIESTLHSRAA